ncbi:cell division control protein 14, SIN component-domain-containing protein [Entophlyctis helioformis]|nr:cell division control protein 14, SIN component-domain-containing protein [Entophlyctis helioformis]
MASTVPAAAHAQQPNASKAVYALDTPDSVSEWERIENIQHKQRRKIDVCLAQQLQDGAVSERAKGLRTLRKLLSTFTAEERSVFAILQRKQDCSVERVLRDLIRKRVSPSIADSTASQEMLALLDLLQGLVLIHYDSKIRAGAKESQTVLLTFLPAKNIALAIAAIEAIQCILVDSCQNLRVFESIGGLRLVCETLKSKRASEAVLHKCIELLCVYMQPETGYPDTSLGDHTRMMPVSTKRDAVAQLVGDAFVKRLVDIVT